MATELAISRYFDHRPERGGGLEVPTGNREQQNGVRMATRLFLPITMATAKPISLSGAPARNRRSGLSEANREPLYFRGAAVRMLLSVINVNARPLMTHTRMK